MDIIAANIPHAMTKAELQAFFKDFSRDAEFEIVRLKGKHDVVVFGHVYIPKDRVGAKAIRKLHLKVVQGRRIQVREYQVRASSHERRNVGWRNNPGRNRNAGFTNAALYVSILLRKTRLLKPI